MKQAFAKETFADLTTISAMALRREPGRVLDRAEFGNETFVVERAGRPKAAIVPLRELEELRRIKREARERFFAMTDDLRQRFAQLDDAEVEQLVEETIQDVRSKPRKAA